MAIRTDKSIFYHIPKTGGMWVKQAMKNAGLDWRTAAPKNLLHPFAPMLYRTHVEPDYVIRAHKKNRFSFCFVRQPEDWYRSYWCKRIETIYMNGKGDIDQMLLRDFDQWVNAILNEYPQGFVTQLYYYFTGADCMKVDFIGRYESLADDLIRALRFSGEDFDIEKLCATEPVNCSVNKDSAVLSQSTTKRIARAERWVLETFYP